MNAAESTDRRALAAEFKQAVELLALRIRIQNALGEGTLEELEDLLSQAHNLSTQNENAEALNPRRSLLQTYEAPSLFSDSRIA